MKKTTFLVLALSCFLFTTTPSLGMMVLAVEEGAASAPSCSMTPADLAQIPAQAICDSIIKESKTDKGTIFEIPHKGSFSIVKTDLYLIPPFNSQESLSMSFVSLEPLKVLALKPYSFNVSLDCSPIDKTRAILPLPPSLKPSGGELTLFSILPLREGTAILFLSASLLTKAEVSLFHSSRSDQEKTSSAHALPSAPLSFSVPHSGSGLNSCSPEESRIKNGQMILGNP